MIIGGIIAIGAFLFIQRDILCTLLAQIPSDKPFLGTGLCHEHAKKTIAEVCAEFPDTKLCKEQTGEPYPRLSPEQEAEQASMYAGYY